MTCVYCKGRMSRASAPLHIERSGYHLALCAVPAWICVQCGEPYFEVRELGTIQAMIHALDEQTRRFNEDATLTPM